MSRVRDVLRSTWLRVVVLPVRLFRAERDLRSGRLLAALHGFQRALRDCPGSFRAHFGLARVHLATRDVAAARRELVVARNLAPARFRELRHQLPEPFRHEDHVAPATAIEPAHLSRLASDELLLGDFVDDDERRRFESMGPIDIDDVARIDWDELLRQLDPHED